MFDNSVENLICLIIINHCSFTGLSNIKIHLLLVGNALEDHV